MRAPRRLRPLILLLAAAGPAEGAGSQGALPAQSAQGALPAPGSLPLPVSPTCISSPFGWRHAVGPRAPAGMHNGIDLPAPIGAFVHAVAPGRIAVIKRMGMGGLQVVVDHGGYSTLYAHLGTVTPVLAEGKRTVAAGDPIGRVGYTGISYGAHLFFEVMVRGVPVDPAPLFAVAPCGAKTGGAPSAAAGVAHPPGGEAGNRADRQPGEEHP